MSESKTTPIKLSFEVTPHRAKHHLSVDLGSDMAEGIVIDGNYEVAARGVGRLDEQLPPGRYQLRVRVGNSAKQLWIDLNKDRVLEIDPQDTLATSPAPFNPKQWPNELLSGIQSAAGTAQVLVVIRDQVYEVPDHGEVLLLRGDERQCRAKRTTFQNDQIVALAFTALRPGAYRVRVGSKWGSPVEMAIWVADGYQTQMYFERCPVRRLQGVERAPHFRTAAVTLVKPQQELEKLRAVWLSTEMMRANLGENSRIAPLNDINQALQEKFGCPMLGLLGAHQLSWLQRRHPESASLAQVSSAHVLEVLDNLKLILPKCPDVLALRAAALGEPIPTLRMPPMLHESWSLIAPNASVKAIPKGSLASRIGLALTNIRPWLVWKTELLSSDEPKATFVEAQVLGMPKSRRNIGALAGQYSLPRSTVQTLLKKTYVADSYGPGEQVTDAADATTTESGALDGGA